MKQPMWPLLGLATTLVLSGCSTSSITGEDSVFRNKALDYTQAATVQRLQVPEDLQADRLQHDLLVVPDVDTSASQAGMKEAPRPNFVFAEMGSQSAQLLGANEAKHIAVEGDAELVWQQVVKFWQLQNMPLATNQPAEGVMETEWVALPGVDEDPGLVGGWLRSLTGGNNDLAYSKVRTSMANSQTGQIMISLNYVQASHEQVADGMQADWLNQGQHVEGRSELMFELLQYLSRTVRTAQKSAMQSEVTSGLLGKDQNGRPLIRLETKPEQAMHILLTAMQDMDVGSHDMEAGKIYFTHTTHVQAVAPEAGGSGLWAWFKNLHSGDNNKQDMGPITLDMSLLGGSADADAEPEPQIVYSSKGVAPSVSDDPKDRKGFKIWMGGEVIYIFEDEDQGEVGEDGVYTFTGNFQLHLIPTLKGVYVQVFTSKGGHAATAHAEEILWLIKQGL
jgi:uncharacterized lipoprotein